MISDIEFRSADPAYSLVLRDLKPAEANSFQCYLDVRSDGFSGRVPFWPERFALERFLDELRAMDRTLSGTALLQPEWELEYVRLVIGRTGSIQVSGELGSADSNYLKFSFMSDQTMLRPLIRDLESALSGSAAVG
jgi:hypothetical protein